jgi:hypothetical protein
MSNAITAGWQRFCLLALFVSLSLNNTLLDAFQADLPEEWKSGLAQITEGRVTGTIAFLASDELAGRGTPSREFNIAAAYVAARFRGAGLKGGGKDGGFYQETMMREVQTPSSGLVYQTTSGADLPHFGLLAATEALDYSGPTTLVDPEQDLSQLKLDGVATVLWKSEAKGNRAISQVARLANSLKSAGAKALVLYTADGSELVQLGLAARERSRIEAPRSQISLPVLLGKGDPAVGEVRLTVPALIVTELPMRNVIGVLEGSDPQLKQEAILFTAHLDHLGARPGTGDDNIYNGADDDASGCTAVMTLADAFAALPNRPKRSIIFMTFWGEEQGLLGSRQFASEPTWPLEKIVANVNIEMIGRPEAGANEKIWMTGWQASDLGALMNTEAGKIGVEIFEHPRFSAMLYRASDNWSLVEKGVIAHSFSAGSLHPDYHQPDDEWERLNIPHMTRVIQGLFIGSQGICSGEKTPKAAK